MWPCAIRLGMGGCTAQYYYIPVGEGGRLSYHIWEELPWVNNGE